MGQIQRPPPWLIDSLGLLPRSLGSPLVVWERLGKVATSPFPNTGQVRARCIQRTTPNPGAMRRLRFYPKPSHMTPNDSHDFSARQKCSRLSIIPILQRFTVSKIQTVRITLAPVVVQALDTHRLRCMDTSANALVFSKVATNRYQPTTCGRSAWLLHVGGQGCAGLIGTRFATHTALSSTIWELQ